MERNEILKMLEDGIQETKKKKKKEEAEREENLKREVNGISSWLVDMFEKLYNKKELCIIVETKKDDNEEDVFIKMYDNTNGWATFQISEEYLATGNKDTVISAMRYLVKLSEESDIITIEETKVEEKFNIKIKWEG